VFLYHSSQHAKRLMALVMCSVYIDYGCTQLTNDELVEPLEKREAEADKERQQKQEHRELVRNRASLW
jgi:hypothetical protein